MIPKVRRKILRRYTTNPIVFGTRNSEMFHQGRMENVSLRGMEFESPIAIDPGDRVWIQNGPAGKPLDKGLTQDGIEATVCWCRKPLENDGQPFSVGVAFMQQRDLTH